MSIVPTLCPNHACPSRSGAARFSCRRRGSFERKCDQRTVQRFKCNVCPRGFSEQTFCVNYRLKRPDLLVKFFIDRVSKVSHRQSARNHRCSRGTEERQFRRMSAHCKDFHEVQLEAITARGGLGEVFLLDELESYEHNRRKKPVTVPVLMERGSGFVIDTRVGTLPARRKKGQRKPPGEEVRKSESRKVVREAFERLRQVAPKEGKVRVLTDMKTSYAKILPQLFGERCVHRTTHSGDERDVRNPLWPINHSLARVRDNVSRLVRRNWGGSKLRRWLAGHFSIWTCYRNYVRGRTNRTPTKTPAMALGALERQWGVEQLLDRRIFR
jgi:CRISPR/Cas system-associated protein endoribonuclease Cas2